MTAEPASSRQAARGNCSANVAAFTLDDFEDFRRLFSQWSGEFRQISRGAFQGRARIYTGPGLRAFQVATNQSIFTRGLDKSDFAIVIPITPACEATLWRGRKLSAGQLLVKGPNVEYYNQTARNTEFNALLVPVQIIKRLVGADTEFLVGRKAYSSLALTPTANAIRRLEASIDALLAQPGPVDEAKARSMEQACIDHLADCLLGHGAQPRIQVLHSKRLDLLNQSLEFMNGRLGHDLSAKELYAELGVSGRTLRRSFKQVLGTGPIAFFRLMRMNAVRQELKSNRESGRSVAGIAGRYGIRRLGEFAADYRNLFGEMPSETLCVRGHPGIQKTVRS
ncbi:MAG: helix-turn-helix domain-containing protein [Xanthomonadales bacterium]|jgi:AraC family ethanolamine operon transcriptional activator|nr:helix-turn-helix domain-containing protein [Xanthomonadales bacterium]